VKVDVRKLGFGFIVRWFSGDLCRGTIKIGITARTSEL
jgi:hypothetical protein